MADLGYKKKEKLTSNMSSTYQDEQQESNGSVGSGTSKQIGWITTGARAYISRLEVLRVLDHYDCREAGLGYKKKQEVN